VKKFFRITYYLGVIILFLSVAAIGFTQTRAFRSYLRGLIIDAASAGLYGEITLGQLQGNLFTGFRVDSVALCIPGEEVIVIDRVEAHYDVLSLLAKHLSLSRVTVVNPSIHLSRSLEGVWNISQLLKPTPVDTVPSPWTIDIGQIEIRNGRALLVDSLTLARHAADSSFSLHKDQFNYALMRLDSIGLVASIRVRSGDISVGVRSLSFVSTEPAFALKRLEGDLALTGSEVSAENLEIETARSSLRLDARMQNINLATMETLESIGQSPLSLRLRAGNVDFGELKQFIGSAIDFLDGGVACEVEAEGTLSELKVKNLVIRTPLSVLRTTGTISNLHRPRDLELELAFLNNTVDPTDIADHLPGLKLPEFRSLGTVEYDLWYKGSPLYFDTRVTASTDGGSIAVEGTLDIRNSDLAYEATVRTSDLNLALVFDDSVLTSRLNSTLTCRGSGTSRASAVTLLRAEIDSSEFYGLPVGRSVLVVDLAEGILRSRIAAHVSATRVDLSGTMKFLQSGPEAYEFDGRVNSLNLAEITKSEKQTSDLSFDLDIRGTGLSAASMHGNLGVQFLRSSYDTVRFEGGGFNVSLNTADRREQSFRFRSDAVDIDVAGQFGPAALAATLGQGATLLAEALQYRVRSLDSLRSFSPRHDVASEFRSSVTGPREHVSVQIAVNIRNASAIGILLGRTIGGTLTLNGNVTASIDGIEFRGSADVPRAVYADHDVDLVFAEGTVTYEITGLERTTVVQSLAASVHAQARSLVLGSLHASDLLVDLQSRGDSSHYRFSALIDSLVTLEARGTSRSDSGFIALNLEHLRADFSGYAFGNIDPIRIRVGRDGLHVANLWMRHEVEEVSASGYFNPAGISDVTVGVRNFLLNNLPRMFHHLAPETPGGGFGGIVNAVGTFRGSFDHPNFSVELNATGVRYRETLLGQILIRSSYFERTLDIFTQFRSRPDDLSIQPDLLINGTVPYNLSLKGSSDAKLEGEMNLDVRTNDFRLEFLDPFVAPLSNMSGLLICDMKLRGTVESPLYEGSMTLQNARFLFNPLGIQYVVDGKLMPDGRRIALENLTVRNIQQDRPDGKMDLSGYFTLEGIEVRDFDLTANGQLLIMKESSRRPGQIVYGDLFVASGPGGIQWQGMPSRSLVSGDLFVRYVNLTLPPIRQAQELPSSRIAVTFVDDVSSAHRRTGEQSNVLSRPGASSPAPGNRNGESERFARLTPIPQQMTERSFLDNIAFNLLIQTQGVTQVRFVFTNLTSEELFAILQGRATFTKDGEQMRLTGEVELGSGSYYNNIKRLDASGKLRFTGSPFNPELDVLARYEGVYRGVPDTTSTLSESRAGATSTGAQGSEQKVVVKLFITGTRDQPKVKTELERYDQLGNLITETRGDVEADAISFLITGSFRDELTQQDRLSLASTSVLGGLTSSVLSGPLTDLLRKEFGIIRSVDVLYYGGSFQESADVRVTGELGDAVFRLGGRVLNDINNTNVSIQLPMSAILGSERWRNLILEAERRVEGVETVDQRRESKGLRLLYRIVF